MVDRFANQSWLLVKNQRIMDRGRDTLFLQGSLDFAPIIHLHSELGMYQPHLVLCR
jgi:hypothetical protein